MDRVTNARSQLIHRLFSFKVVKEAHRKTIHENLRRLEKEIVALQNIMSSFGSRFVDGYVWCLNWCSCQYCEVVVIEEDHGIRAVQIYQRRTFSKFMELPYELRLRIWQFAEGKLYSVSIFRVS
jgi:hypothetical protein